MSDPRIGRVLIASLHQGILDLLPGRIDFYENWLTTSGLREGTIGLAPLSAVLSFLRLEGEAYDRVTACAGEYAAEWTVAGMPALERRIISALPRWWRARRALRIARGLVTATYPGTRAIIRVRGAKASVELRGSLFCEVREASVQPLCAFYVAAVARLLGLFSVPAAVGVHACRAAGAQRGCLLAIVFERPRRSKKPPPVPDGPAGDSTT
jgi:hypothetical protein